MATPAQVAANQANSQLSTGPKSAETKARSSRNSFKHGLYAKALVLPGEDPAELDQLRASLRAEHQPANTTEDILVNELAENFWRIRRMRAREAVAMEPENLQFWMETGLLALVHRTMASAQREFHRALADLRRLQKDRGFVPQHAGDSAAQPAHPAPEIGFVPENAQTPEPQIGFVPSQTHQPSPGTILIDPKNSDGLYRATGFRTPEELRADILANSLVAIKLPENLS
jgi:hypothetical protein